MCHYSEPLDDKVVLSDDNTENRNWSCHAPWLLFIYSRLSGVNLQMSLNASVDELGVNT